MPRPTGRSMRRYEDHFLTRRDLFRIGGVAMTGVSFLPLIAPKAKAAGGAKPRGTARFCIFVMLEGGQSHVDSWDFKEGKWTPPDFEVKEIPGVGKWPMGLYPKLGERMSNFTLLRSIEAWESQHGRGQ